MPPRIKAASEFSNEESSDITVDGSGSKSLMQFHSIVKSIDNESQTLRQLLPTEKEKAANRFDKYKKELKRNVIEEYETPHDRDAKAILLKKLKLNRALTGKEDVYLGKNYYKSYLSKEDTVSTNATSQKYKAGPVRLSSTNRISCRFDFRPDVCKDYKETGSCGFGDSCIYIHDRDDYKSGWQLEEEWAPNIPSSSNEEPPEQDTSVKVGEVTECSICNSSFKDPVITKCSHMFCQICAMNHFKASKNGTCFTCKMKTDGLFRPCLKPKNSLKSL